MASHFEPRMSPPMVTRSGRQSYGLMDAVARLLILLNLALCVVFPHSFQVPTAVLLALSTLICLFAMRSSEYFDRLLPFYFLGVLVSSFYIWLGFTHRAPMDSVLQNAAVYIVSPLAWLIVSTVTFQQYGIEKTVRILVWLTFIAMASVALFFFAFLTFGKEAVSFLTDEANVNVDGGYAGATILVYGSLIFLCGGAFAEPNVIKNKFARILVPGLLVVCALTSGRSALILAIPIGFIFGTFVRARSKVANASGEQRKSFLLPTILMGVVMIAVVIIIDIVSDRINLSIIFGEFFDELGSGGGSLRTDQISALLEGVLDTYGVGAGHGIGVDYIRSAIYPWRYEVLPLATLYRVGVIGTAIYASIFVVYGIAFTRNFYAGTLREEDIYMGGGFVAALLGTFTNPYMESFIFQWMYFMPVLSIGIVKLHQSNKAGN